MFRRGDGLGRYVLLEQIAVGGMGEVFVAARPGPVGFGPLVALKILRPELAEDPQFVDMLIDEANISMFLNHQNVVSVLDLGQHEGTYFIAMEYVQGITAERLVDRLNHAQRNLDVPLALFVGIELSRALKYAHSRVDHSGRSLGIVHRDVTPANILLSVQGEVKLTDFGIARARNRTHQTQAGMLKGKFGYMAPEMVRGDAVDHRVDLFCAGVSLYLLLTGHHPAAHCTAVEAIQRFENRAVPPPSSLNPLISEAVDAVVAKALEPDPERRFASAAQLADALQDCLLSRADWRGRQGSSRLAELLHAVSPESFREPVSAAQLDALFQSAVEATRPRPAGSRAVEPSAGGDATLPTDENTAVVEGPELPMSSPTSTPLLPAEPGGGVWDTSSSDLDEATVATPSASMEPDFSGEVSMPDTADLADRTVASAPVFGPPSDLEDFDDPSTVAAPMPGAGRGAGPDALASVASRDGPAPNPAEPASPDRSEARPQASSWSDESAARHLLATRNLDGAAPTSPIPDPAVQPTFSQPAARPEPSSPAPRRSGPGAAPWVGSLLAVVAAAAFLIGSQALWPQLRLETEPAGATARVDGQPVGQTPVTVRVRPGVGHLIDFRKPGFRPAARRTIQDVSWGRSYTVRVVLQPGPKPSQGP